MAVFENKGFILQTFKERYTVPNALLYVHVQNYGLQYSCHNFMYFIRAIWLQNL